MMIVKSPCLVTYFNCALSSSLVLPTALLDPVEEKGFGNRGNGFSFKEINRRIVATESKSIPTPNFPEISIPSSPRSLNYRYRIQFKSKRHKDSSKPPLID